MSLMYSTAKDRPITRAELYSVPTPPPKGRCHKPYPFAEYADTVVEGLERRGFEISAEEYAIQKDGQRMFGLIEISPGEMLMPAKKDNDWSLLVGLRGSHDQAFARGLTMGSRVIVCSNLCFHGELLTMKTMQTLHIADRLPGLIGDALDRIPAMAGDQERRFATYKNTAIAKETGDQMLVEIHRRKGFSGSQLATAVREWDNPCHEEHVIQGNRFEYKSRSVWQLFNACTEAIKPTGNHVNMDIIRARSQVADHVVSNFVGMAA